MKPISAGQIMTLVLIVAAFAVGASLTALNNQQPAIGAPPTNTPHAIALAVTGTATETVPPNTPLSTFTPSATLRPPPTFEPPTATMPPSLTPSITPTATIDLSINIPGLIGFQTPTSVVPEGCQPRKDWKLTYTVQRGDALARIADVYNTSVNALIQGNCLSNGNVIVVGQVLKVPGTVQPSTPQYACVPFDVQTPFNGTLNVPLTGFMTFDWHGPLVPYTLIRITRPDSTRFEDVVELRQNDTIDVALNLTESGTYKW
ncbi:MAG TPA: LysM peptidoglycan-binding domain-containing protein, partial [Aggregatilineales bacterium]|nr:LysM peptidoglycan-binding domain-containing protein [Aggregatilineales bacterium]